MIAYVDTGEKIEIVKFYEGQKISDLKGQDIKRIRFHCIDDAKEASSWIDFKKL